MAALRSPRKRRCPDSLCLQEPSFQSSREGPTLCSARLGPALRHRKPCQFLNVISRRNSFFCKKKNLGFVGSTSNYCYDYYYYHHCRHHHCRFIIIYSPGFIHQEVILQSVDVLAPFSLHFSHCLFYFTALRWLLNDTEKSKGELPPYKGLTV